MLISLLRQTEIGRLAMQGLPAASIRKAKNCDLSGNLAFRLFVNALATNVL
jgi:hypothetical protein